METRYTKFSNILIEATEKVVHVESKRDNHMWIANDILDDGREAPTKT